MLSLRGVTGETEAAIGHEPRDRRLAVAGIARLVRVHRICMGCPGVTAAAVAAGAVAPRAVVILMAGCAALHGKRGVQRDR